MSRDALMLEIARCDREIARCESGLRDGGDIDGFGLGMHDWAAERRMLVAELAAS